VNQTGAGNTRVLAESVPSNPGLKNSVNICGETTSISLADAELLGESSVTGAGMAAVVDGMDALEGATVFVSTEFGAVAAISGEFVGAGRSTSMGGSANDVAMAAEKRSGGGPICFKYALFPRICGAAHKASITTITVSLRIFNSPMTSPCFIGLRRIAARRYPFEPVTAAPVQLVVGKSCRGLREIFVLWVSGDARRV
jgi:hypothetical protein